MKEYDFEYSLELSQRVIDMFYKTKDKNGVSHITQGDLEKELGISRRNIKDRMNRLNWVDKCIEVLPNRMGYKVYYNNISERGTYFEIKKLIDDYTAGKVLLTEKDKGISERYKVDIRVVYAFKTFVRMKNKEIEIKKQD